MHQRREFGVEKSVGDGHLGTRLQRPADDHVSAVWWRRLPDVVPRREATGRLASVSVELHLQSLKKKTKKKQTHFQDRSESLPSFCTNSFAIFQDRSGSFRIAQVSAIVLNRFVRNFSGLFRIVKDLLGSFRVFQDRLGSLRIIQISAIVLNKLVCNFSGSFRIVQDFSGSNSISFPLFPISLLQNFLNLCNIPRGSLHNVIFVNLLIRLSDASDALFFITSAPHQ